MKWVVSTSDQHSGMKYQKRTVLPVALMIVATTIVWVVKDGLGTADRDSQKLESSKRLFLDMMNDPNPETRERGAIKYSRIKGVAVEPLLTLLKEDPQEIVRAAAALGIGNLKAYRQIDDLIVGMEDPSPLVRGRCHMAIRTIFGVSVNFKPDDPEEKRLKAIETVKSFAPMLKEKYAETLRDLSGAHTE